MSMAKLLPKAKGMSIVWLATGDHLSAILLHVLPLEIMGSVLMSQAHVTTIGRADVLALDCHRRHCASHYTGELAPLLT